MINAEFSRCKEGLSLRICGHAEHMSDKGDVVCAAVSGIFYAVLGYAANECESLKINAVGSGLADIECSTDGISAMKLAYIGLLQISLTYPDCISVRESVWSLRTGSPVSV